MSDAPTGPGWWQASDGRWYPPESRPAPPPLSPPNMWQPSKKGRSGLNGWAKGCIIAGSVLAFLVFIGAVGAAVDTSGKKQVSATATTTEGTRRLTTTSMAAPTTTTTIDRAALMAEYDAEVASSCARAVEVPSNVDDSDAATQQQIFWEKRWAPIASQPQFVADVETCSTPQRQERAASQCTSDVPIELLSRDADQFKGQCFVLVFRILQFDQNTGPCTFRAYFDVAIQEYNFQYQGDNSLVSFKSPCPELNPLGEDDVVRMQVKVLGSQDYSTVIGGSTSTVKFARVGGPEILQDN